MMKLPEGPIKYLLCLLLALAVLLPYWPIQNYPFIHYDDGLYVLENTRIQEGFTPEALRWLWQDVHTGHWHPLTWLSHMLDWQLFGNNAGGHHWTNVLFHLANTLLLFLVLEYLTGARAKSLCCAALFALHPLNVESVAWVAERKNVLSTFFWIATMGAYGYYVRRPGFFRYAGVFILFALGLMAKPMLVTLPLILLLLDYWPLKRWPRAASGLGPKKDWPFLLAEKFPLLLLSVLSSLMTVQAARDGGALRSLTVFPLGMRLENALVAPVRYLEKLVLPRELAVFYPFASGYDWWQPAGAALLLGGITLLLFKLASRYPYAIVGWLWFLVTLLPVLGIVQVGYQAMADRYAYVPAIGLFLLLAWGVPDLAATLKYRRQLLATATALVLILLTGATLLQVSYWQGSLPLFCHALQVTEKNHIAHLALGTFLLGRGSSAEAAVHFAEALRIKPDLAEAHNNLGIVFLERGDMAGAMARFAEAIRIDKTFAKAYNNMGIALLRQGKISAARPWFQKALAINPSYRAARRNLDALRKDFHLKE